MKNWLPKIFLIIIFSLLIFYCARLQFLSPVLYGIDDYFHIAISDQIKNHGIHHGFPWHQFSTFSGFYADNDFLFHLSLVPFLYFSDSLVLAAKYATIFYNALFFIIYLFILRKHLSIRLLAVCFLILPLFSTYFFYYFIGLRGYNLANIFIILSIYSLINKKWIKLFAVSILYALSHLSFPMVVIFALLCEIIRYLYEKEFFLRNIYVALIGVMLGVIIHPNFPNNLLNLRLNVLLTPYHMFNNSWPPAVELGSAAARFVFKNNFCLFLGIGLVIWLQLFFQRRWRFSTLAWWGCASLYLLASFFCDRFWHTANVLFFIFIASYADDLINGVGERARLPGVARALVLISVIITLLFFLPGTFKAVKKTINFHIYHNTHYEKVARWMDKNIPPGETIFHANISDSAYFICLNPKNKYLASCDPIYMFHYSPEAFMAYQALKGGKYLRPDNVLTRLFNARYGYARKMHVLSQQIKNDPGHFAILYEDALGMVFLVKPDQGESN